MVIGFNSVLYPISESDGMVTVGVCVLSGTLGELVTIQTFTDDIVDISRLV